MKDTIGWESTEAPEPKHRFNRLGCIFIVIIAFLFFACFLFPALMRAREGALRAKCLSNVKQIGMALKQYALDNNEILPFGGDNVEPYRAFGLLYPKYIELGTFRCPSADSLPIKIAMFDIEKDNFPFKKSCKFLSYAYGHNQGKPWTEAVHSSTGLAADKYAVHDYSIEPYPRNKPMNHPKTIFRSGGRHVVYLDGAAKWDWSLKMLEANPEWDVKAGMSINELGYKKLPDSYPEHDQTGADWWSDPPEK